APAEVLQIAVVAAKHLVATIAGQDHLDRLSGELRDEVCRNDGGIAKRFIEMSDNVAKDVGALRAKHEFVMIGLQMASDLSGVGELVECLVLEADGEGLDAMVEASSHQGHDHARIDSAAQERPDGYIADESESNS